MTAYMVNLNNYEVDAGSTIIPLEVLEVERDRVFFVDREMGVAYMPNRTQNTAAFASRDEAKEFFKQSIDRQRGMLYRQIGVMQKLDAHLETL